MLGWFKRSKNGTTVAESEKSDREGCFERERGVEILREVKKEFGLDFDKKVQITLKKLERFALQRDIYSYETLQQQIARSDITKRELINMLTVGETYFYRELEQIELLGEEILSGRCKSVLSAPCSSGEEVYSILLHLINTDAIPPSLHIKGIDINTDALASAEKGCFSKRSISQLPSNIAEKWFTRNGDKFCIDPSLKSYTGFAYAKYSIPGFIVSENSMRFFHAI